MSQSWRFNPSASTSVETSVFNSTSPFWNLYSGLLLGENLPTIRALLLSPLYITSTSFRLPPGFKFSWIYRAVSAYWVKIKHFPTFKRSVSSSFINLWSLASFSGVIGSTKASICFNNWISCSMCSFKISISKSSTLYFPETFLKASIRSCSSAWFGSYKIARASSPAGTKPWANASLKRWCNISSLFTVCLKAYTLDSNLLNKRTRIKPRKLIPARFKLL